MASEFDHRYGCDHDHPHGCDRDHPYGCDHDHPYGCDHELLMLNETFYAFSMLHIAVMSLPTM